jgi:REP element-mobilizing transposase RayT
MIRTARMVFPDQPAVYLVMSRTALDKFTMGSVEKDYFLKLIKRFSKLYFTEILGFCLMDNYFHLLVKMVPDTDFSDNDIKKRLRLFYGENYEIMAGQLPLLRLKLANLSEFVRDIEVTFARYYNRCHNRRGYVWGDRFKCVMVDRRETLLNCLTYIDLNPLRAGLVKQPEKYRWNSIGYHLQAGNKDHFLSTDFGLKKFNVNSEKERIRCYLRYMYEIGSIDGPDISRVKVIDPRIFAKQKKKDFEITKICRLRYRTRYFTDSGIIGSKAFVANHYQRFQHLFAV